MVNEIKEVAERLRGLRDALDMSVTDCANKVGISQQLYEQYESGDVDIPMSFLMKVAASFGVELSALLSGTGGHDVSYSITRKGKGNSVERVKAYKYQSLTGQFKNPKCTPFLVTVEPKADNVPYNLNTHDSDEMDMVMSGRLEMSIDGRIEVLEEGDAIYFDARRPHGMKALDDKPAQFLAIVF